MTNRPFAIDPRKFIVGPFGDCPKCGGGEYGTLSVSNNRHTRRCRACWYTATTELPPVQKKLIYVDQNALSNMAKELDPEWSARTRRQDPFWLDLYDQLERLVKLQAIACPQSPIHEQEASYDDRVEGVLDRLCHHLSAGVTFDFPEEIRARQLWHAQEAYMRGEAPDWDAILPEDVTDGRLDEWTDRMSIRANMGHLESAEERRARRDALGDTMARIWEAYQREGWSFQEAYEREVRGIADASVEAYRRDLERQADLLSGKPIDDLMKLIPNSYSRLFTSTANRFGEAGLSEEDPKKQAVDFLYSEHALNTPQNQLGAMLFAALARRATNGQKRPPDRGTPNDFDMISSYLPYCDAIFVDDEMAQILSEEPLASEVEKHGTKVFSTRTRAEFLEYLKGVEDSLPQDHVERVVDTYGESWLEGFRSLLEQERAREARANGIGQNEAGPEEEALPEALPE